MKCLQHKNSFFEKAVNILLLVSADEKLRFEVELKEKAELMKKG